MTITESDHQKNDLYTGGGEIDPPPRPQSVYYMGVVGKGSTVTVLQEMMIRPMGRQGEEEYYPFALAQEFQKHQIQSGPQ